MRLIKITSFYPAYLESYYRKYSSIIGKTYLEQKEALDFDAFGWADYWGNALTPLGYEVMEVTWNAEPLQRAWARENLLPNYLGIDLRAIAAEQAKRFRPDILWMEDHDEGLIKRIRLKSSAMRFVIGWTGSAILRKDLWKDVDLVLSCAPESVDWLRKAGACAAHLPHGFDQRINDRLLAGPKKFKFSFIGQLIGGSQFHSRRERILGEILSRIPIDIFSSGSDYGWRDYLHSCLMIGAYETVHAMKAMGFPETVVRSLPIVGKASQWTSRPGIPRETTLKAHLNPPVFGLDMFQVLRDSHLALNIHADSSPRFASNMRLFETTGVGTCLVTDWRENLPELFDAGKEVVVYRSAEECVEQVNWLLTHPAKMDEIAKAGQARTIREHTFADRALRFDEIVKKAIRKKYPLR